MNSYKVYIENQKILFTDDLSFSPEKSGNGTALPVGSPAQPQTDCLRLKPAESVSFAKVLEKLQNTKQVTVISGNIEQVFARFRRDFLHIEAGGGLVTDPNGNTLMIFRNGKWDLPKGKREPGESNEACAVREVEEECGVHGLQNRGFIADTFHLYPLNGNWVFKTTTWYDMACHGTQPLVPQTGEGISRAEWVSPENLAEKAEASYFTIRDVLRTAGKI